MMMMVMIMTMMIMFIDAAGEDESLSLDETEEGLPLKTPKWLHQGCFALLKCVLSF